MLIVSLSRPIYTFIYIVRSDDVVSGIIVTIPNIMLTLVEFSQKECQNQLLFYIIFIHSSINSSGVKRKTSQRFQLKFMSIRAT